MRLDELGIYAFYGCSVLKEISIPEGVQEIGDSTFLGCTQLESVTIPSTVTTIGKLAFRNCSSLTTITIPSGVSTIRGLAFDGCNLLREVTIIGKTSSQIVSLVANAEFGTGYNTNQEPFQFKVDFKDESGNIIYTINGEG